MNVVNKNHIIDTAHHAAYHILFHQFPYHFFHIQVLQFCNSVLEGRTQNSPLSLLCLRCQHPCMLSNRAKIFVTVQNHRQPWISGLSCELYGLWSRRAYTEILMKEPESVKTKEKRKARRQVKERKYFSRVADCLENWSALMRQLAWSMRSQK